MINELGGNPGLGDCDVLAAHALSYGGRRCPETYKIPVNQRIFSPLVWCNTLQAMTRLSAHIMLLFMVFFSIAAYGQEARPATSKISAAEILQRNLIATGGLEAHQRIQTLTARGEFRFSSYPLHQMGDYSFFYKAPSSDILRMDLISHGTCWSGRRENQKVILRCGVEGPGMINGVSIGIVEQDWRSLVQWEFSRDYEKVELIGRAEVEKRWAYAVRFTPRNGDPEVRFYDYETFLLVRMDQVQRFRWNKSDPEVAYAVKSYFRDYKDQDGLKLPRVIAVSRTEGELLFNVSKIQPDAKIDDSVFQ